MPREPLERLKELQESARERAREAQERLKNLEGTAREAQERALELAREAAAAAQDRTRAAREAMPPGLLVRILSTLVGFPLLSLVFVEASPDLPGLIFTVSISIFALLAAGEYFRGLKARGFRPIEPIAYVAVVVLQFAAWNVARGKLIPLLPVLLMVMTIVTLVTAVLRREREPLASLGVTFFGVIYIGWLFSYLVQLRSIPGALSVATPWGPLPPIARGAWLVLYVMAVTWLTDTGAYLVGSRLGKTKLAPRLSPGKTREGALGGLLFATVASLLWGVWVGIPWAHALVLGPLLGALAQIGDLCESALKRDLGVKDFGGIMPGHGGVLDRFDSILFTAPIAYYYLVIVLPRL